MMQRRVKSRNPFDSNNRNHFPGYSPMFRARSTPSPEKFQWSIDNIAILKPVEIDVSSHNPDHSYSPETEAEIQRKADTFFAQKSILPSPWLPEKTAAKHVTFSPRPPQTEYYLDESLVMESSNTHVKEVSCQTLLTFPVDVKLEELVGPQYLHADADDSDWANSSLRRKLFGKPNQNSSSVDVYDQASNFERGSPPLTDTGNRREMEYSEVPGKAKREESVVSPEVVVSKEVLGSLHPTATALHSSFDTREPFPVFLSPLDSQPSSGKKRDTHRDLSMATGPISNSLQSVVTPTPISRNFHHIPATTPIFNRSQTVATERGLTVPSTLSMTPISGSSSSAATHHHTPVSSGSTAAHCRTPVSVGSTTAHCRTLVSVGSTATHCRTPVSVGSTTAHGRTPVSGGSTAAHCRTPLNTVIPHLHTPFLSPITCHSTRSSGSSGKITSTPARHGGDTMDVASSPVVPSQEDSIESESRSEDPSSPSPTPAILNCEDLEDVDELNTTDRPTDMSVDTADTTQENAANACFQVAHDDKYRVASGMSGRRDSGVVNFHPRMKGESESVGTHSPALTSAMECMTGITDNRELVGNSMSVFHCGKTQDSDSGINMSRLPSETLSHTGHQQLSYRPTSLYRSPSNSSSFADCSSMCVTPRGSCMPSQPWKVPPTTPSKSNCKKSLPPHETPKSRNSFRIHSSNSRVDSSNTLDDCSTPSNTSFSIMIRDIMRKKDFLKAKLQRGPVVSLESSVGFSSPFGSATQQLKRSFGHTGNTALLQNGSFPHCGSDFRKPLQPGGGKENSLRSSLVESPRLQGTTLATGAHDDWRRTASKWNNWP